MKKNKKSVLVAMSGGVDSAVAALLLKQHGYVVTAVHLVFFNEKKETREKLNQLCSELDIPLVIENRKQEFKKKVIDNFISQYRQGQTPNPCVVCNEKLKFKYLFELADQMGIDFVATGHYARISKNSQEHYLLKRGKDLKKDQSYFLYRILKNDLRRLVFPLGELKKEQTKKIASKELKTEFSSESQDVCFFSKEKDLKEFFKKRKIFFKSGEIIDETGRKLGWHSGLELFTLGQRQGLGISGGPWYVIDKKMEEHQLIVSKNKKHQKLEPQKIEIIDVVWQNENIIVSKDYLIQIRYGSQAKRGRILSSNKHQATIELLETKYAVAVGQSLVVYDDDVVLGGGIIKSYV